MDEFVPLFKHTPSAQKAAILARLTVQRGPLVDEIVRQALDRDTPPRHRLISGPRGIGKTHVLALVADGVHDADRARETVVIASLDEDPWAIRTYAKFLAAILARIASESGDEALGREAAQLRASTDAADGARGEQLLREAIGDRRLLLIVENLHDVFRRIGEDGQRRLSAFAREWGRMLVLAATPQPVDDILRADAPFAGFFEITPLDELTLASATELLRRVAQLRRDDRLLRYLETDEATQRLAAVEALAGGHPRIWLMLAGCISTSAIDRLVPLFMEALDEITPYYQDRLRELGDQQQELVVLLSEAGGALSNRQLSERSGIAQNQVATILRQLTDRGYVRRAALPDELAAGDRRMSFWELREPLMRLCLDVKQSRGEPLKIVVAFLRAWYGPHLLDELDQLPESAQLARRYVSEAFRTLDAPLDMGTLLEGDAAEALARIELGLEIKPEDDELRYAQVTALISNKRYEEARERLLLLLEAEQERPLRIGLQLQLAAVRGLMGEEVDGDDLVAVAEELCREQPDSPEALGLAGSALNAAGRHADAVDVYARAIELNPANASYLRGWGRALLECGRAEDALEAFDRALALDPEHARLHDDRARALHRLERFEEALGALDAALALDPENATVHDDRGVVLTTLERYDEAIQAYERSLEIAPETARVHLKRAVVLGRVERVEEARLGLVRAGELDPQDPTVAHAHAVAASQLGRQEEALEAFTRAVVLAPDDAELHDQFGRWLVRAGRLEDAVEPLERAVALAPTSAYAHIYLALALLGSGRLDEGERAYRRALELVPSDAGLLRMWAHILVGLEREEEALAAYARAAELEPEEAGHHDDRAQLLLTLDRLDEAEAAARQAVAIDDATAAHRFTLATILLARGDAEQALELLREALARWSVTDRRTPAGEPELLCRLMWQAERGPRRRDVIARLVTAYRQADALGELGSGLVRSVPVLAADAVSQHEADAWIEDWAQAPFPEGDVAIRMLRAAGAWKRDRDQAHLLALPAEQRAIVVELLGSQA